MRNWYVLFMVWALVLLVAGLWAAETVLYSDNFDDGSLDGALVKIRRYDDDPTVVSSDTDFPAAFPPPSGSYCVRVADDDNTFWGLGSAIRPESSGNYVSRFDPTFNSCTVEAKIYLAPSTSTTENVFCLVAIDDRTVLGTEMYYRFGHRNGNIYFQIFDGANFTTVGEDPDLTGLGVTVPGWNTFTMHFTPPDRIDCTVNGNTPSWSPVNDDTVKVITVGVLGFDFSTQNPILADDMLLSVDPATLPVELSAFTAD